MITFIIGLVILALGGAVYGKVCEKVICPTDKKTPAEEKYDGVDYVPMSKLKNSLIELLNIAGTGPILGPIQGILFGPIAFITIPIGCVLGGAFHDYMAGMISVRNNGEQMPGLVKRFLGKYMYIIYNVMVFLMLVNLTAVFVYTPGDLFITQLLKKESTLSSPVGIAVYGCIFLYFVIATLLPIDKIIGKIYPLFGGILLISAMGVFAGIFTKGYELEEIWETGFSFVNPFGERFIPIFFVTVACGIVSGFHSTQSTLISRTLKSEKDGRTTFYNMMILEGFIAMVWAAAAMGAVKAGLATNEMLHDSATKVIGIVAKDMLGSIGGTIAIIGIIVLPITSGDTAMRSLRLTIAETLHIDTGKKKNNLFIALPLFFVVAVIVIFAKSNASGFNILWRYFSWTNETIAAASFAMISVYMLKNGKPYLMALIPGIFYMYVCSCYILSAKIGLGLPWGVSYLIAGALSLGYAAAIVTYGRKKALPAPPADNG